MKVTLVRYTQAPDTLCGEAAALCTGYTGDPVKALRGAMKSGHESVAEHATFTFRAEDVSRVTLAQLTRHRLMSFSVQSQRYCGAEGLQTVTPDKACTPDTVDEIVEAKKACWKAYDKMIELGIPAEDARYILPQGITTKLMLTANARELRHFFSLRCCNRAQWEIRALADEMLRLYKEVAPVLFEDAGPGCVRGRCPEGAKSCGEPRVIGGVNNGNDRCTAAEIVRGHPHSDGEPRHPAEGGCHARGVHVPRQPVDGHGMQEQDERDQVERGM